MFKSLKNAWAIPEMKKKMLYTLFILLLYRIGACIHVPYTDYEVIGTAIAGANFFSYLNLISGGALEQATLFALSISPYITASIVMQLLTVAIPYLERKSKEEDGQKFITKWTRVVTVILGFVTAFGYYLVMKNSGWLTDAGESTFGAFVIIFCYAAGAALIMWLAEKINENGIGNGISIILFANILASMSAGAISMITGAFQGGIAWGGNLIPRAWGILFVEILLFVSLILITFIVFVTNSERRLPVQYAKKVVGRKMYGGQSTTLPIKLNMSGVMPIIFAQSIVTIPSTIEMIANPKSGSFWDKFFGVFAHDSWLYVILFFILIILFGYFYIMISFNPIEVSNNLKKNGGFIPGIRPGKPTSDYITKILNRITLIGSLFLGIIAVLPLIVNIISGSQLGSLAFGGSSLLILVGVILETAREIEAQMTMRHYKGFLD